jgi:hypothetical protein
MSPMIGFKLMGYYFRFMNSRSTTTSAQQNTDNLNALFLSCSMESMNSMTVCQHDFYHDIECMMQAASVSCVRGFHVAPLVITAIRGTVCVLSAPSV